ncbi:hypothetical protein J3Q64DRAFT_1695464 [Phycomyces blakesleeanus]|uniref:Uncharacterized protein n=1 Tax=Phycomyces blakesleeanus TaxID=4837 RepID=A0ABR3BAA8_PHYBL
MHIKSMYEPKDARTLSIQRGGEEDPDDMSLFSTSDSTPRQTRKKGTDTQALVEFLNNTSPEEFRHVNERTSATNLFFRRRKNKQPPPAVTRPSPSPSTSCPVPGSAPSSTTTLLNDALLKERKSYIEIVANPSRSRESSTSSLQPTLTPHIRHSDSQLPILPSKSQRESSLYSESLRHSTSIRSQMSSNPRTRSLMRQDTYSSVNSNTRSPRDAKEKRRVEAVVSSLAADGRETIEAGLIQRLERYRVSKADKPSDVVSTDLAAEHIRALHVSAPKPAGMVKVRHVQVQTMSWSETPSLPTSTIVIAPKKIKSETPRTVESLERQLEEERQQRKRAEAALEETMDNFEVLSGLAYKKLRELWEEKMRWENACVELRDRLLETMHPTSLDYTPVSLPSDYVESTL